ncbi:hypothetical protein V8B55DRAFT_1102636 [Mucor lusitanicus]|nr:hypothetical protein FB192DRAFT_1089106 [Mucor lusitanicus]
MTTITCLPNELLLNVFNKFDTLTHLAKCRAVCKTWKKLAERTMLGHVIAITSYEAKMRSLYAFLQAVPARQHLLKHLHFCLTRPHRSIDTIRLIQLVLTPSIESLTGHIFDQVLSNLFIDIIQGSCTDRLGRLNTLALSCHIGPPFEVALRCRATIQDLWLYNIMAPWTLADRLSEFQHLTFLTLATQTVNISLVDKILDNCLHLQELSLGFIVEHYEQQAPTATSIKKHPTLKALTIRPHSVWLLFFLMDYFFSKLINIEEISVNALAYPTLTDQDRDNFLRIPKLIHQVAQKELTCTLVHKDDARALLLYLKQAGYNRTIKAISSGRYLIEVAL